MIQNSNACPSDSPQAKSSAPVERWLDEVVQPAPLLSTLSPDPDCLRRVVFPGLLGGLTKTTLDVITPIASEHLMAGFMAPFIAIPFPFNFVLLACANMFLGAISALIGTFVLSDLLEFQKSSRKIFGLSLVFGLSFSLVFDAASSKLSLESEIQSLEGERTQLQGMVLDSLVQSEPSLAERQVNLQTIRLLTEQTEDIFLQEKAIQSMMILANQSSDMALKHTALKCLSRLVSQTEFPGIQTDAILAMEKIALATNERQVRVRSLEELELIKSDIKPEAQKTLQQVMKHLNR